MPWLVDIHQEKTNTPLTNDYQQAPYMEPKPVFGPNQIFYDDTTAWKAFWQILCPNNPTYFKDACNGTRLGF